MYSMLFAIQIKANDRLIVVITIICMLFACGSSRPLLRPWCLCYQVDQRVHCRTYMLAYISNLIWHVYIYVYYVTKRSEAMRTWSSYITISPSVFRSHRPNIVRAFTIRTSCVALHDEDNDRTPSSEYFTKRPIQWRISCTSQRLVHYAYVLTRQMTGSCYQGHLCWEVRILEIRGVSQ